MKSPQTSELIRNPRFLQILILIVILLVGVCLFVFIFTQLTPLQNLTGARASATPVLPPTSVAQSIQTVVVVATSPPTLPPPPSPTALPSATTTPTMTPTVTRTPTITATPDPWVTLGQYPSSCNTELTFNPITARKFRLQVLNGGGADRTISFYCCTSLGAGWLVNGVWIPVNNPSLTLKVGDIRETDEFTPTVVSQMRFNIGCNDNETSDLRVSYLPALTVTPTVTSTVTLTGTLPITITPTITTTATITTTSSITATTTPTATSAITATATVTATRPPAPKGSIAYRINENGTDRLRVLNLENNNNTPFIEIGPVMDIALRTNAAFGAWSPDNSKFAYIWTDSPNSSNILRVVDFKLGTTRSIYSPDTGGGLSSPTWSPDGTKIALVRLSSKQIDWSVIAINVDATRCSNKYECEITSNTQGEQFRGGLAWASQGLFVLSINTTGANEVFTMWSDGGGRTNLTNNAADDTTPTWSPDGNLIAFTSNRDGRPQIFVMNPDGSNLRKLSRGETPDFEPTWSPDGKWIAFASVRNNTTDIYMMDLNGNNVTRLTTNGGDRPIWTR